MEHEWHTNGRAMSESHVSQHETQVRDRFDKWSESLSFQLLRTWLAFLQGQILDSIDWSRANHVLDVACGSGLAVYEAARRLPSNGGGFACGCDISEGMLRQRIEDHPASANAHFLVASAQSPPYKDDSFDAVICTAAFHHFPIPETALREIWRVLRPDGKLLIADTCRDQSLGIWVWDRLHRWFEKGHVKYYRTEELIALLRDGGFERVEVTTLSPSYAETRKLARKAAVFSATVPR